MTRAVLIVCGLTWLGLAFSGCASAPPTNSVIVQCIPLKGWSDADQDKLRAEYDALPKGAKLRIVFQDYAAMRDADRACIAANK